MCVSLPKYFRFPNLSELDSSLVVSLPGLYEKSLEPVYSDSLFTKKPLLGNSELEKYES